jgi:hypothetical protein
MRLALDLSGHTHRAVALPSSTRAESARVELEAAGHRYVGMSTNCTTTRPGNGGLRVRSYDSAEAAEQEAEALTAAMTLKHAAYNTGFTGAKLVRTRPSVRCRGSIRTAR